MQSDFSESSQRSLALGTVVEHFKVVRLVGRGGMGEVYLARDTRLGRRVALKVISAKVLTDDSARQRFMNEARLTARFSHPHIVTVHHVGEIDADTPQAARPYLAMEYLEGQSLGDRLAEEQLGLKEALRLAKAIAEALAEAHRHDVLHRDLKPGNVVIPSDGRLRVLDFGLAKRWIDQPEAVPEGEEAPVSEGGALKPPRSGASSDETLDFPPRDANVTAVGMGALSLDLSARLDSVESLVGLAGTPSYMAPEQWRMESGSPATDVWALGLILHELLTGAHPHAKLGVHALCTNVISPTPVRSLGESQPDLPDELVALVDACVAKEPAERPSAEDVVQRLELLLAERRPLGGAEKNPFRGLLPFGERHAGHFYGREAEVAAMLERLRAEPVLPVVGPSGAGKSSFVQAGVIPRLREGQRWRVLRLRPGSRPFLALATRLLADEASSPRTASSISELNVAVADGHRSDDRRRAVEQLADELQAEPGRLALELLRRAERDQTRVLLYVDQLEELYTLVPDADAESRPRFMEAITTAADDPEGPVRVMFTLRDDFLGRVAESPSARQALGRVTVLRTPDAGTLREILARPVAAAGYRFDEEALLDEMVAEVAGAGSALPLLQFAGREIWERRDPKRRVLTRAAYGAVGGVTGALARHADGVLDGLGPAEERVARTLFLRLVAPEGTRRVVERGRLLDGLDTAAADVLDTLVRARAIVARKGLGEPELELVHESLISQWGRLSRWLDESREERQFLTEAGQAAALWEKRGRPAEEVWRGPALVEARLKADRVAHLPASVSAFLDAATVLELRQRRKRRIGLALAGAVLLLLALGGVLLSLAMRSKERDAQRARARAEAQRTEAFRQRKAAQDKRAEALEAGARAALARGDPLEARARLRGALQIRSSLSIRSLWWQLKEVPLLWKKLLGATVYDAAFSPDGNRLAVSCADHSIYVFNVRTGTARILRGHTDQVFTVAFAPDGLQLASGDWGGRVLLWNLRTGRFKHLGRHKRGVFDITFDPRGARVASASFDHTVRLWDARRRTALAVLKGHTRRIYGVAFSPDGKLLASASVDNTVRLWEARSGRLQKVLRGHKKGLRAVAFNRRGDLLAVGGGDGTIWLWDPQTGQRRGVLRGHTDAVLGVAFDVTGTLLVSGSRDRTLRLWDVRRRKAHSIMLDHEAHITRVSFSPVDTRFTSVGIDGSVRLWRVGKRRSSSLGAHQDQGVYGVTFSPDGKRVASVSADKTARLWDTATGRVTAVLRGHAGGVLGLAYGPRGELIATSSYDHTVRLWDVRLGRSRSVLRGSGAGLFGLAFSPDGSLLAAGSGDMSIYLWDVSTGRRRRVLRGHKTSVFSVAFNPQGTLLASASGDRTIKLWDVRTGRLRRTLSGHEDIVWAVSFSPDGARLASGGADKTVRIWDVRTGKNTQVLRGHKGRIYWLHFHPDGKHVGSPSADRTARLWDLTNGDHITIRGHRSEVNSLRFSRQGDRVVTGSDDGTVRLWDARTGRPIWHAPLLRPHTTELRSHRGWLRLDGAPATTPSAASRRWRRRVANHARLAAEADDGRLLCIATHDKHLELWSLPQGRRLQRTPLARVTRLLAFSDACVTLAGGVLRAHPSRGKARRLRPTSAVITAVDRSGGTLLATAARQVYRLTLDGKVLARYDADLRATAVGSAGDWIVVGYRDGNLELVPTQSNRRKPKFTFESVPAMPVVRIIAGPKGTVLAGFANGLVGLWNLHNGALLRKAQLHGPVIHLLRKRRKLYAATLLGDYLVWDLGVFHLKDCRLLREVWNQVPIVWVQGLPKVRPIPRKHRCTRRGGR